MKKLSFTSALKSARLVEGRISDGPVVSVSKTQVELHADHFTDGRYKWATDLMHDSYQVLKIGDLADSRAVPCPNECNTDITLLNAIRSVRLIVVRIAGGPILRLSKVQARHAEAGFHRFPFMWKLFKRYDLLIIGGACAELGDPQDWPLGKMPVA